MNLKTHNQSGGHDNKGNTAAFKFFTHSSFFWMIGALLVLSIVGYLVYSNTLNSPFVLDDSRFITENPNIRVTQISLTKILKAGFQIAKTRPVATTTFVVNYLFGQYHVFGYHIVNVAIHIFTAFFMFLFLSATLRLSPLQSRYAQPELIAFATALIWLIHPVQTQSVTYIIQRMNSMAAMFYILAFWFYIKGRLTQQPDKKKVWFFGAALAWILSLGCKQNAAILPFFIFLYEWYFFQNLSETWIKSYLKYLIACMVLVLLVAFVFLGLNPIEKLSALKDFSNDEFTWSQRVMTQPRVVIYYISLLFFPHPSRLNLDYDFPLSYALFSPFTTLLSVLAIIGLVGLSAYLAKKERLISFCLFWFLGNLVIESSVIPLAIIFEHRTYLPSMLLLLIPITLGNRHLKFRGLKIGLLLMVAVILAVWTYQRNQVWKDEVTLWIDVVKKSPNKARPHLNLGQSLSIKGSIDEAAQQYRQALQINPRYAMAHFNLANVLQQQGRHAEAIEHYKTAIQIDPGHIDAHNNLGLALARQGRRKEAIKHYLEILKINPADVKAHSNLGVTLTELGETDQAISHFQQVLEANPADAEAHYNLAIALEIQQKDDEAVNHYLAALERNPGHALAHFNAANIFARQQKFDEAVRHYEKSLAIQSDFPRAINNLAMMYALQKNYTKALSRFKEVLLHWPDKAETHYNIACMYSRLQKEEESIEWLQRAIDKGYSNWESIKSDSDLENIRDADAYKQLVRGH